MFTKIQKESGETENQQGGGFPSRLLKVKNKLLQTKFSQEIFQRGVTVFCCVCIIVFGITLLSKADPIITSIGQDISTNNLSLSGSVTSGTWAGSSIDIAHGGTGQDWSAATQGSLPFFSGTGALSTLTPGTAGQFLQSAGVGANPGWGNGPAGATNVTRAATFTIAASDSSALSKQQADYVCDGTDDNVEIQAAINALPITANSYGTGHITLLEGDYYITNPIELRNSIVVSGQGPRSTNLWQRASSNIFQYSGGTYIYFVTIENLGLWGDKNTYATGRGIDFITHDNVADSLIFNVWADGFNQENIYTCAWNCKIISTKSEHSNSYGIAGGNEIIGVHSIYNTYGIRVGSDARVTNCFFWRNLKLAMFISSSLGSSIVNNRIAANNEDYIDPWMSSVYIAPESVGVIFTNNHVDADSYLQPGVQNGYFALKDAGSKSIIKDNYFSGFKTASTAVYKLGTGSMIQGNLGYPTENSGTSTITAGQTSVTVTHGLATTPTRVQLTPTTLTGGKDYYISAKTATTFTITIDSVNASDITFDWRGVVGEGN